VAIQRDCPQRVRPDRLLYYTSDKTRRLLSAIQLDVLQTLLLASSFPEPLLQVTCRGVKAIFEPAAGLGPVFQTSGIDSTGLRQKAEYPIASSDTRKFCFVSRRNRSYSDYSLARIYIETVIGTAHRAPSGETSRCPPADLDQNPSGRDRERRESRGASTDGPATHRRRPSSFTR